MEEGFILMNLSKYKRLRVLLQSDCKTTIKKRTASSCVFTCSGKLGKGGKDKTE